MQTKPGYLTTEETARQLTQKSLRRTQVLKGAVVQQKSPLVTLPAELTVREQYPGYNRTVEKALAWVRTAYWVRKGEIAVVPAK